MQEKDLFIGSLDDYANKFKSGFHFHSDIIPTDYKGLLDEYENGAQTGEPCRVREISDIFSWKRGFQNCWTGFPNSGKTQYAVFMMTLKAITDNWKFVIWSPEMKSSRMQDNDVKINMNDMYNMMIWIVSGKTPYKHIHEKYGWERVSIEEFNEIVKFIEKNFFFIDPLNKSADAIKDMLIKLYDKVGFDGVLIDPFKNVHHDIKLRDDIYLDRLFDDFKDFAVKTNSSMNWIAHPKAGTYREIDIDGQRRSVVCNQYMLNGGSSWDNSMDGIYSIGRPEVPIDPKSTLTDFHNLKQRKQELVASRGSHEFNLDLKTRRYMFPSDPFA